jgi:hypothetical protein
VYLASGSAASGNPYFSLRDVNDGVLFIVDQSGNTQIAGVLQGAPVPGTGAGRPVNALAYNVAGWGPVIDAAGNWVGRPVGGQPQTPWVQNINGQGWSLTNVGNIYAWQYFSNSGAQVIDMSGNFIGPGVNVHTGAVYCGYLATNQTPGGANQIDTGTLNAAAHINTNGILINGVQKCGGDGVWTGSVQTADYVFGRQFGIIGSPVGNRLGWPIDGSLGAFYIPRGDGTYIAIYVLGGIIVNVA